MRIIRILSLIISVIPALTYYSQDSAPQPYEHSPQAFLRSMRDVEFVCTDRQTNIISKKEETHSNLEQSLEANTSVRMEWTLHSDQMFQYLGFRSKANARRSTLKIKNSCRTIREIHSSLTQSFGNRSCTIPWLSPAGVCEVMQMYSNIRWWGDSLTRHTVQGLFMLLSGNFRYGGFPNVPEMDTSIYSRCNCDGQFSESTACRDFGAGKLIIPNDARKAGLCYFSKQFRPFSFLWYTSLATAQLQTDTSFLCSSDSAPKFLYLQGGAHYQTNADGLYYLLIRPIFESINRTIASCPYDVSSKVRIAISGVNICDKAVSAKYPHQSDSNSIYFTKRLHELMKQYYPAVPVVIIDFLSITKEAIDCGRTSDGYHFLSDINLMKAMTILNVMRAMAEDPTFAVPFQIPEPPPKYTRKKRASIN